MPAGVYIGRIAALQGKHALLQPADEEGFVCAQFDDLKLNIPGLNYLQYGWTVFYRTDFCFDPIVDWSDVDERPAEDNRSTIGYNKQYSTAYWNPP